MLKSELAEILSDKTDLPKAAVLEGLREIVDFMTETLRLSETIEIRGFGSFVVKNHRNRQARNPKTGETFIMESHRVPRFSPSRMLLRRLNHE